MRQPSNPKRGRGRNSGRKPQQSRNQTFDSNGPAIRVRGNAYQVMEKYLAMARDASATGDRVTAENYYQHAEHYYRLLNANSGQDRNPQRDGNGRPRDDQDSPKESGQEVQAQAASGAPADRPTNGAGRGHGRRASNGAEPAHAAEAQTADPVKAPEPAQAQPAQAQPVESQPPESQPVEAQPAPAPEAAQGPAPAAPESANSPEPANGGEPTEGSEQRQV
jgi:hypothetical protein